MWRIWWIWQDFVRFAKLLELNLMNKWQMQQIFNNFSICHSHQIHQICCFVGTPLLSSFALWRNFIKFAMLAEFVKIAALSEPLCPAQSLFGKLLSSSPFSANLTDSSKSQLGWYPSPSQLLFSGISSNSLFLPNLSDSSKSLLHR